MSFFSWCLKLVFDYYFYCHSCEIVFRLFVILFGFFVSFLFLFLSGGEGGNEHI